MKKCKIVEKEKAFCMKMQADELFENAEKESILVQGIVDLYGITQNDEIILVDYKTDFVQNENELILKYSNQLEIYKNALEEAINKKVSEMYIYSLYLNKEIKIK
jgi:ATP-dependent helicase/nuclease subunit A